VNQIQFLKDITPPTKRAPITQARVEWEDEQAEKEKASQSEQHLQQGRIKIPVDPNQVLSNQAPEPVHVNAFRRFMMGRKGGMKFYDKEVNYANQKKG
jgi:hypothetical protein